MRQTPTPQADPSPGRRMPRRYWLILAVLFLLSQVLNVWIITRTISGGFEGWLTQLGGGRRPPAMTARDPLPRLVPPQAVAPPDTPSALPPRDFAVASTLSPAQAP